MTMSAIWTRAKDAAARSLAAGGGSNGVQNARVFIAGFSGGLGKRLETFEAQHRLADMQKAGQRAIATIQAYRKHVSQQHQLLTDPVSVTVCETTKNVLTTFEVTITRRITAVHKATGSVAMTLGSMRTYWKTTKKKIEAEVKASQDRVDVAGIKALLSEFDGGLGKALDTFERVFPDVLRMKQSKARLLAIIHGYRKSIAKIERKPDADSDSYRLEAGLQRTFTVVLDQFEAHVEGVIKQVEHAANDAWLRRVPA